MKKLEKHYQFAAQITGALGELFDEDSEHYIDSEDLQGNLTDFIHALSNIVPTAIYNELTGENKNILHFNHTANQLIFQYDKNK